MLWALVPYCKIYPDFETSENTYQMFDCQQVVPSNGVSAWSRDLSHGQREAQEHKHTQTLYLQFTKAHFKVSICQHIFKYCKLLCTCVRMYESTSTGSMTKIKIAA